jgi:DNA topoisomerase III
MQKDKIVVIAEKPSLAKAIRAVVGADFTVTSAFGHVYEQAEPDFYLPSTVPLNAKGKKKWRMEDLPIVPIDWKLIAKPDCKDQIQKIKELLSGADLVINAGDPDREGQLLIDEILAELKFKGKVERVWLTSLTPEGIRKAFRELRPNQQYRPLCDAAMARSHADWLVGMNLTRAWTLKSGAMLSVGRVQSPTLALVVKRDLAIENFTARDYYDMLAHMKHASGEFTAKWKPSSTDGAGFDEDGRLVDKRIADALVAKSGVATIADYTATPKKRSAPLPYSLSALQKAASAKHGMGAQAVLDAAQELYEGGYTSYPRTDCQYLGNDQHDALAKVAQDLAGKFGVEVDGSLKHAAFDDKKVTAHTAIVPTGKDAAGNLAGNAAKLYDMIARSLVSMFMAPEEYLVVNVTADMGGERWQATGKQVMKPGWTALFGKEDQDEEAEAEPVLPAMKPGDTAQGSVEAKSSKTKPPKRFTEGMLIDAMSNIHRYIEDPTAKAKLKETSGIGTEATRANIIETLFKRNWLVKQGKSIVSTPDGRAVIAALPSALTDPVTTAQWEEQLSLIAAGSMPRMEFELGIAQFVKEQIGQAKGAAIDLNRNQGAPGAPGGVKCPHCEDGTVRRMESKKKKGVFFWACSNRSHGLMSDDKGKPGKLF